MLASGTWREFRLIDTLDLSKRPKHEPLACCRAAAVHDEFSILRVEPDPQDGRRSYYKLAPGVKASTTQEGRTLDFGCCIIRC